MPSAACNLKLLWSRRLAASRAYREGRLSFVSKMYPDVEGWVIENAALPMSEILALANKALG